MVSHYFGGYMGVPLSESHATMIDEAWSVLSRAGTQVQLTPAQLEQLCVENRTVDSLCETLGVLGEACCEAAK